MRISPNSSRRKSWTIPCCRYLLATLLGHTGTTIRNHVWVIVSDPLQDAEKIVFVNFTSHKDGKDESCVLLPGDHPFIIRKTIISYADAASASIEQLSLLNATNTMYLVESINDDVLSRIRLGMMQSPFSKRGLKKILEDQALV